MNGFSRNLVAVALFCVVVLAVGVLHCSTQSREPFATASIDNRLGATSPSVSLALIRQIHAGMTRDQVRSTLGLFDRMFYSFSLEETFGEWTIEYFWDNDGGLLVGSVRHPRIGELLQPSGLPAVQRFCEVRRLSRQ